jgi:hypothetical protein
VLSRDEAGDDSDEPAGHVTAWWCAKCGGIDAPQPCLGICVWRPAEWVNRSVYESERSGAATERALIRLLRRVAFVTPRDGQWERNWLIVHSQARDALRACASEAGRIRASA